MPQYVPIRGKSGRVIVDTGTGPTEIASCIEIEWNIEIEELEVLQGIGYWKGRIDGDIDGTGQLTIAKSDSYFESLMIPYLTMRPDEARALRDSGQRLRTPFTLESILDDPQVLGGYESLTLRNCLIWNLPGGHARGSNINRRMRFSFEGIRPGSLIPYQAPDRSALTV